VAGAGDGVMVALVRHSRRKRGATDRPDLTPPRQSSTLHAKDKLAGDSIYVSGEPTAFADPKGTDAKNIISGAIGLRIRVTDTKARPPKSMPEKDRRWWKPSPRDVLKKSIYEFKGKSGAMKAPAVAEGEASIADAMFAGRYKIALSAQADMLISSTVVLPLPSKPGLLPEACAEGQIDLVVDSVSLDKQHMSTGFPTGASGWRSETFWEKLETFTLTLKFDSCKPHVSYQPHVSKVVWDSFNIKKTKIPEIRSALFRYSAPGLRSDRFRVSLDLKSMIMRGKLYEICRSDPWKRGENPLMHGVRGVPHVMWDSGNLRTVGPMGELDEKE